MTPRPSRSRLYRALLRLFPNDFRRQFGPDMEQLFADRRREAERDDRSGAGLWWDALGDIGSQAAQEWAMRLRRSTRGTFREGMRMDGWRQDLSFGIRTLARRPGFTVAAVATLALGIGSTVSIFSVVDRVLFEPLPFPDPDRLVTIWNVDTPSGSRSQGIDHPDVRIWQDQVAGMDVAGYAGSRPTLTGLGRPEVVTGARVTDGLITLMGYTPALGRDLVRADDVPGGPSIVVVSYSFWADRLGRDPDAIGRSVVFSGEPFEIVGVAPAGFDFPGGSEVWVPRRHEVDDCGHGCRIMQAVGRLHPDATIEEVQSNLDAVSARLASEYPDSHRDARTDLEVMAETEVADVRTGLWVLFGAVGMVLLIACANVANLLLVRASQRTEEVALRMSLGASRARIVRQLLTESMILAGLAGLLGLVMSTWGTSMLVAMAPDTLPRLAGAGLSPTVMVFTAALVVGVTSLFGVFPAVQLSGRALRVEMSGTGRSAGRPGSGLSRSFLIAGEIALSLALLSGAGLLFRTLIEIRSVDYGFDIEASERFRISIPDSRYDSLAIGRFVDELEGRLGTLPGLAAVGTGFGVPLASGNITTTVNLLDRPEVPPADRPPMDIRPSTPGLLAAAGMRLMSGRWFTPDDAYGVEGVGVINEAAVRRYYPDVDPIGRRLRAEVSWSFEETPPLTIVGVVGDVRGDAATAEPSPALYLPNAQFGANSLYVWLRLEPGIPTVMPEARAQLAELDPELAITSVTTIEEVVGAQQLTPRFYLTLLALFSAVALVLATIGLYGVVAYSVSQRTREIGIRIALGACSDQVVRMVAGQSVRPVLGGIAAGILISIAGARVLETLLFGVEPHDPLTLVMMSALLLVVAVGATMLPAWRAARVPAADALRSE